LSDLVIAAALPTQCRLVKLRLLISRRHCESVTPELLKFSDNLNTDEAIPHYETQL